MEYRPVINAAREGVHPGSTRNCVSRRLLGGELIDARRRRSAQLSTAVHPKVAEADVVSKDEENVGLLVCGLNRNG